MTSEIHNTSGEVIGIILDGTNPKRVQIEIDPNALIEVDLSENPNSMSEADFQGLVGSIKQLGFDQTVTVWKDSESCWRIIDGHHRKRAGVICGLTRIPAIWWVGLRPGEDKLARIALNRFRGTILQDIEQRQLAELLTTYKWDPNDLLVSGYSESELSALGGLQGTQLGELTENLGNLTGSGSAPPEGDEDEEKEPTKTASLMEIAFESSEDYRECKKVLRRYAKAAGVTKGPRTLSIGLLGLIRQIEDGD